MEDKPMFFDFMSKMALLWGCIFGIPITLGLLAFVVTWVRHRRNSGENETATYRRMQKNTLAMLELCFLLGGVLLASAWVFSWENHWYASLGFVILIGGCMLTSLHANKRLQATA